MRARRPPPARVPRFHPSGPPVDVRALQPGEVALRLASCVFGGVEALPGGLSGLVELAALPAYALEFSDGPRAEAALGDLL
jgi:hypothetical protein